MPTSKPKRNDALYDYWSLVHIFSGVMFGWCVSPIAAIILLALWEPLENFVISPIMARFGVVFGYESWRNALSDIFFDGIGVLAGYYLLSRVVEPPFHLF